MEKRQEINNVISQLRWVFGITVVILLGSSVASFYANKELISSSQWVNHTNEVMYNAETLFSTIKDAETGQRGYIITRDSGFLKPYAGAYDSTIKVYKHLLQLTADNHLQQQHLLKIKEIIEERYDQIKKVLARNEATRGATRATVFVADHSDMVRGREIMEQLREIVNQMKAEEQRLLEIRLREQKLFVTATPILVIIASVLSILISIMAYFRIRADLSQRLKQQLEDEATYTRTAIRIKDMEAVTSKIADGDYTARSNDGQKDELGRIAVALNSMAVSLQTSDLERRKHSWLQSAALRLGGDIRGVQFLENVAVKILQSVARTLDAPVATIYVSGDSGRLTLKGSYAASDAPKEIIPGQGLAGQALRDMKMIVAGKLPQGYLNIRSTTGSGAAVYVVAMPLIYAGAPAGVMELGFLQQPDDLHIRFLEDNADTIAIALNAAASFEKVQNLLEETQAQSEELQAQHNELEHINSELEMQAERLQASEEELRVQQEELQQANQELEERTHQLEEKNSQILDKTHEIQRKAEELAESTRYKSEFLANMSHELRTPLNSILLLSRLLSENGTGNLNGDQVEYARVIQSSGNGLLTLIDEILDLSKIEAGKMQVENEPVSINEIMGDMRALFEPVAKEQKVDFRLEADNNLPATLETDKLRLGQILKNLLSNAFKFTPKGRVTLQVHETPDREGFISCSVTDTGIGIDEEKQQLIFEAFQQADGSTRRKYGGTGLGLSISRQLARLLGGDIYLESKPGAGSTFTVTLPVVALPADTAGQHYNAGAVTPAVHQPELVERIIPESIPDDRGVVNAGDKVILIIEDDTQFAGSLLNYTRNMGYKGLVAVRGDEGVELARRYKPAGILLDVKLPVISGWDVLNALKLDKTTQHIPVHIVSSLPVHRESMQRGAINYIEKPLGNEKMRELFSNLERFLDKDPGKVLIVEENTRHARALAWYLESFNIPADIAAGVPKAIELLKKADCVILDTGMPDAGAYQLLEDARKHDGLEHLLVIVFTGKNISLTEEQRIRQFADSIVVKTAHSFQRILDEVTLFLHQVEEQGKKLPGSSRKLGALNDVLTGRTVLVVDDDVRNIFSLTRTLEHVGMTVIAAIDGNEALERLKENPMIDAVLLDMMMPARDGYETARNIRQHSEWKKLPVIAVTAKAMVGDRDKCIQAGASDYITKPVDTDQLLSLLRVWLYEKAQNAYG